MDVNWAIDEVMEGTYPVPQDITQAMFPVSVNTDEGHGLILWCVYLQGCCPASDQFAQQVMKQLAESVKLKNTPRGLIYDNDHGAGFSDN